MIHASLGKGRPIVTRDLITSDGVDLTIELITPANAGLADTLPEHPSLRRIEPKVTKLTNVPMTAARRALEQAHEYDLVGYIEDDLAIESRDFFQKILWLVKEFGPRYAFTSSMRTYIRDEEM